MAKIGIVDTNCTNYAKALIGVVVTSLNAGTTMSKAMSCLKQYIALD